MTMVCVDDSLYPHLMFARITVPVAGQYLSDKYPTIELFTHSLHQDDNYQIA